MRENVNSRQIDSCVYIYIYMGVAGQLHHHLARHFSNDWH